MKSRAWEIHFRAAPSSVGKLPWRPLSEADHFWKCPMCGGYVDMRDRAWIDEHQQPLPHPALDRVQ